jgi:hypothetical protein
MERRLSVVPETDDTEDTEDLDAAALRIVWASLQAGARQSDEVRQLLGAELAAARDPLALLSAVTDVGVKLLGMFAELLRREPAAVLRGLANEYRRD